MSLLFMSIRGKDSYWLFQIVEWIQWEIEKFPHSTFNCTLYSLMAPNN